MRLFSVKKIENRKVILLNNFTFFRTFILIASSHIFKNLAILMNHGLFFQEKESSQLYLSQFLEINSLMAEMIENQFSKTKFL